MILISLGMIGIIKKYLKRNGIHFYCFGGGEYMDKVYLCADECDNFCYKENEDNYYCQYYNVEIKDYECCVQCLKDNLKETPCKGRM